MPLLLLALVPSVIALVLLVALVGSLAIRLARGERWEVPLHRTPDMLTQPTEPTLATPEAKGTPVPVA